MVQKGSRLIRWTGSVALLGLLGCASQPVAQQAEVSQEVQAPADPQACSGNLVPPTGYHQETSFVPLSVNDAREQAAETARTRLRDRLCQGYRCEQIAEHITVWRTTQDGRQACVMAVASREKDAAVYAEPTCALEAELAEMVRVIVEALPDRDEGEVNSVALDTINDSEINGKPRAEWLHDQLLSALGFSDVLTRKLPGRWSGLGLPPSTAAVVRGTIRQLPGQEAMLEASFRLERGDEVRGMGSVTFPQAIAPTTDPQTYMPPLPEGNG